jgi:hypothetical protein
VKLQVFSHKYQTNGAGKRRAPNPFRRPGRTKEFNDLVGDLVSALDKFNVPGKEKGELLGALGSMKRDIVGKP